MGTWETDLESVGLLASLGLSVLPALCGCECRGNLSADAVFV